jgi:hypothetical protein
MKTIITLGESVMVSDPCHSIPTWCQVKVDGVLPGKYYTFARQCNDSSWGHRISGITAVHEDYLNHDLKFRRNTGVVGVDSGQAGIFDLASYRNDEIAKSITGGAKFSLDRADQPGDLWYEKMCRITLDRPSWGGYDSGVVTSSGLGDGSYDLYTSKVNKKVVALHIDFQLEKKDCSFYKNDIYANI